MLDRTRHTITCLLVLTAILILCVAGWLPGQSNAGGTASFELRPNSTATMIGVVEDNNKGCQVDATCYLRVRSGGKVYTVAYTPRETPGPVHINEAALKQRLCRHKYDRVRVYGRYSKTAKGQVIDV